MALRLPVSIADTYACYLALLRAGFKPEEISVEFGRLVPNVVDESYVVLSTQGKKIYLSTNTYVNNIKMWNKYQEFLRDGVSEKLQDHQWEKSKYGTDPDEFMKLVQRLQRAGFKLPSLVVPKTIATIKSVDASDV